MKNTTKKPNILMKFQKQDLDKPLYLGHRKRVKQKFLQSLGKDLHDYELLEILLFSAFPRQDTKPLAKKLLAKFGNLSSIISADVEMLKTLEGMGEGAISNIKIISEIINRILKDRAKSKPLLDNWQAVQNYASAALASLNQEVFRVLFLNKNFQLIEDELIAIGENDFVQISVKSIVKKALLLHSSSMILMHNHPTSILKPSISDIKTTKEICLALKPLNIDVIDHLIVGSSGIFSFKEENLL